MSVDTTTKMRSPWWQLIPSDDESNAMVMTFPVSTPRLMIVTTEHDAFVLREDGNNDSTGVALRIDENGQVTLNVGGNATIFVEVNDVIIENGATSPHLKAGDRVKLGGHCYVLKAIPSPVSTLQGAMRQTVSCEICLRRCDRPRLLRCGHSFCASCVNQMVYLSMSAPQQERIDIAALFGEAVDEHELLEQTRTIKCGVCRRLSSCWEASKAVRPNELTKTIELMEELIDYDEIRPKCAACTDTRCFVNTRDFEYCEQCKMVLCPVCALEGHRDHTLTDRKAMLKAMHDSAKRLTVMRMKLRNLRQCNARMQEKLDTLNDEYGRLYNVILDRVSSPVYGCKDALTQIERRLHPFCVLDAALLAKFDDRVKEAETRIQMVRGAVTRFECTLQEAQQAVKEQQTPENVAKREESRQCVIC